MEEVVEVLVAVAERGGVENIIKMMIGTLESQDMHFRVVQMVWEGYRWLDEDIPFYPLLEGRAGHNLQEFMQAYAEHVDAMPKKPDLILAAGWPYLCTVAREVLSALHIKAPVVSWLHADVERYMAAGYGGYEQLAAADAHFAINDVIAGRLKQQFHNVFRVYNPVELPENMAGCDSRASVQRSPGLFHQLLFIGRVSIEKKLDFLVHALADLPEWSLHIVGDGAEREKLCRLAERLGVDDRLLWHGWQTDPWGYLQDEYWDASQKCWRFDALVLSSDYEGFPLTVIEAQGRGIPVLTTKVGGLNTYVKEAENGFLYDKTDTAEFAAILKNAEKRSYLVPDREFCHRCAEPYEKKRALADTQAKMQHVLDQMRQNVAKDAATDLVSDAKISVIIPCYNVEAYIAECLESIFAQTLSDASLEVICVDDKSTDRTLEILVEYEKRYPEQMVLIPLGQNGKQGNARNIGMEYASGQYIAYVDSDDFIVDGMLEKLYKIARESSCEIVKCDYQKINNAAAVMQPDNDAEPIVFDMKHLEQKRRYVIQYAADHYVWATLFRKDFLERHKITFPKDIFMADLWYAQICMLYCQSLAFLNQPYYCYRIHENSVMHSGQIRNYYMDTPRVQNMVVKKAIEERLLGGIEWEYMILYFAKAFVEPVMRMRQDEFFFSYVNIRKIKRDLFGFFPDFLSNPYLNQDSSESMRLYRDILVNDYSEAELRELLYG